MTGVLSASGRQFEDWTAAYRLFSKERFDPAALFDVVRRGVVETLPAGAPLVVAIDDTLLRKTGPTIPGVSYRRDPMGPRFHINFVRAQRMLQISAAVPAMRGASPARLIPIAWKHVPTPRRPRRNASEEEQAAYRQQCREARLGLQARRRLCTLRQALDADGQTERPLHVVGDGGYTHRLVLRGLPERTVFIGRIRADARLYHLPQVGPGRGRPRLYGSPAPTPEQLRQDEDTPWQTTRIHAAGRVHDVRFKQLGPLRWRPAGAEHDVQLVAVAPLGYRLRKNSRMLYRKPAYLICTDPALSPGEILQAYVWRLGIETNFRDEKTLLGSGQAQVRHAASVETVPATLAAAYAMLLLAGVKAWGVQGRGELLPPPRWRRHAGRQRASTQDHINQLRAELWGEALRLPNFSYFADSPPANPSGQNTLFAAASALCYPTG